MRTVAARDIRWYVLAAACVLGVLFWCGTSAQAAAVYADPGGDAMVAKAADDAAEVAEDDPADEIPGWVCWRDRRLSCDGLCVEISERCLQVYERSRCAGSKQTPLTRSDASWRVQDGAAFDVDANGAEELVLLVWRRGSFGSSRPFWLEDGAEEDKQWTQHVYIVRPEQDSSDATWRLRPVWMSSALGIEVQTLSELSGRVLLGHRGGGRSLWEWSSWGLALAENRAGTEALSPTYDAVSVLVGGDVLCHASLCAQMRDEKTGAYDFTGLFAPIAARVGAADLSVACLETALAPGSPAPRELGSFPRFVAPQEVGDALAETGFDAICCATNHMADKGAEGLRETAEYWQETHPELSLVGLHARAASPVVYRAVRGMRIALVGASEHLNGRDVPPDSPYAVDVLNTPGGLDALVEEVRAAETHADATLCIIHAGNEYEAEPSDTQQKIARALVDAGADAVVFTHPHVVLPSERLTRADGTRALVCWSLGNLVSHQPSACTRIGALAEFQLVRSCDGRVVVGRASLTPVVTQVNEQTTRCEFLAL